MIRVLGCIFEQHDLRLVVLAALLCLLATTTAMSMISRARAAVGEMRSVWLATGGAVAGCGIWGLHFVAMLAYGAGLPVAYDPALTFLSAAIAMLLCALGFALALSPAGGLLGGTVTGLAISAMHYTGMAAVRIPALPRWDPVYVAASVIIGVALTAMALDRAMKRDDFRGYAVAAGLFLVAIVGMHFTAMTAVVFVPSPLVPVPQALLAPEMLAVAVAAAVALIMGCGLIGALVDRHLAERVMGEAQRMRDHIAELEATKTELERTTSDLSVALKAAGEASHAKAAFLASMSHELRTPLNAVIGFSDLMVTQAMGPVEQPYRDYAADIHGSGMHLLSLINDVLDLSRLDAGRTELHERVFGLDSTIAEALRLVAGIAAQGRVTLSTELAPGLPLLNADQRRIQQIVLNLLSNAVKFTRPGGRVVVSASLAPAGLALSVADTGIGIAPEDIPTALDRFGQVDSSLARKYEGTGLGLPLAKQFAELHGGTLRLESAVGRGTTVTVTLPAERLVRAEHAAGDVAAA